MSWDPKASALAGKIVSALNGAMLDSGLSPEDQLHVLLAAVLGRAKLAGVPARELPARAKMVWDACELGLTRKVESVPFNFSDEPFERILKP
jgi:hypothetical protein